MALAALCGVLDVGMATKKKPGGDVIWVSAAAIIRGSEILSMIGSLLRGLPELASASSNVKLLPLEDVEDEEDASAIWGCASEGCLVTT
jgi:hypothetical protein